MIRHLPLDSALVTGLNGGQPAWSATDHLLADLWALTVKVHSGDKRQPVDHPVRVEMAAKAKAATKKSLRSVFLQRKNKYQGGE